MVKLSKESLASFQSALETIDTTWQTEFNLREVVRQSLGLIKKAKKYKVSWEKIAEILQQSSGSEDKISPESIRQYYFEFSNHSKSRQNKAGKTSQAQNKLKGKSPVNSQVRKGKTNLEDPDTPDSTFLKPQFEAELHIPEISASVSVSTPEISNAEEQGITQPAIPKSIVKKNDDVKEEFNLSRRKS